MQITVEIEKARLNQLLAELLPITIVLDEAERLDGRWIRIQPVQRLEVVGDGLRLITAGELRWIVGFLRVTVTVERLVLLLRPLVVGTGAESRLLFRPVLEEADLRNLPALLDRRIVALINNALERRTHDTLAWNFGRTLALRFLLPDTLVPLESATVDVDAAQLRVHGDVVQFSVALSPRIRRLAADRAAASPAA